MAFLFKGLKIIREHWKKSICFSLIIGYSAKYTKERLEINELMRVYCEAAKLYGDEKANILQSSRTVTVILNPRANKSKAKTEFDKYCAPILHLAGLSVDLILTESEGHAKNVIENRVDQANAIVIGGGDGTVLEVITGLLRRCDNDASKNNCPVGVLPLGRTNSLARSLFPNNNGNVVDNVRSMADAAMAIVKQNTKSIDLMRIEVQRDNDIKNPDHIQENKSVIKPIYAVDKIEWGVFRDARTLTDKYWYFGGLRHYATYLFNGENFQAPCEAVVIYSLPCSGCSNCTKIFGLKHNRRWWNNLFGKRTENTSAQTMMNINNPQCTEKIEKTVSTINFNLRTLNTNLNNTEIPQLILSTGPKQIGYFDFVKQAWLKEIQLTDSISARQVQIVPTKNVDKKHELSIDNEQFELKSITVTLLPKAIQIFT